MPDPEVRKIVKEYAKALKKVNFSFDALYLFGSHAKEDPTEYSDIDVAVISDQLKRNRDQGRLLLWKVRRSVDTRIEPHGFTVEGFADDEDPVAYEIKKTGIRIA